MKFLNFRNKELVLGNGKNRIMVFDCKSNGLYGETFAICAIVFEIDQHGEISIIHRLELRSAEKVTNEWVIENVLPHLPTVETVETNKELRNRFYEFYMKYKNDLYGVYSDVNYPVETNFLRDVVMDDRFRAFDMPYPLYDISTLVDVEVDRERYYNECNAAYILQDVAIRKPKKHDPYWDVITSVFVLTNHPRVTK